MIRKNIVIELNTSLLICKDIITGLIIIHISCERIHNLLGGHGSLPQQHPHLAHSDVILNEVMIMLDITIADKSR